MKVDKKGERKKYAVNLINSKINKYIFMSNKGNK
jgi:hypothetical protein